MRKYMGILGLFWMLASTAVGQLAPPPIDNGMGATLKPDATVEDAIKALADRGTGLSDLSADVTLTETDAVTARDITRKGHFILQRMKNGDTRIRVTFDSKKVGESVIKQRLEYLLENGILIDRSYEKKLEVRRQVVKPGQKMDPLKLGEGPFPLPIGQDPAEVHKQFDVKRIPTAKDEPAGTIHVSYEPKAGTRLAKKFKSIDVWVDPKTNMPVRIETLDTDGATVRTTDLSNIKINSGVTDKDFKLPELSKDWGVRDEALGE